MRRQSFHNINVIPFIDIMLVLLVIVLTTATFIAKGLIPLELPTASQTKKPIPKSITLSIQKNSKIFIDRQEISDIDKAFAMIEHNASITIRADSASRFQDFVRVIEALKKHNLHNVSIVTKHE